MIYYLPWIMLIAASLWVSLLGFLWALKSGQFADQERARYLPLRDGFTPGRGAVSSRLSHEVYALLAVLGMAVLLLLAACAVVIVQAGRG